MIDTLGPASRRRTVDKIWPHQARSTVKRERERPDLNNNRDLLISMQSSSDHLIPLHRRGGDGANAHVSSILPFSIDHLPTKMTSGRT